jgi:UDPglucose--hexose-1-phosphate uridylyltransferase
VSELRTDPLTGLRVVVADGDPIFDGARGDDPPVAWRTVVGANPARDLFAAVPAAGAHERLPFAAQAPEQALDGWRERIRAHAGAACVHVGVDAQAGSGEAHADLYALPFVPQLVARERERFTAYAMRTMGGNLLADLVQEEVRRRERIVAIDDDAVLMAPYGARVAHQLLLAPRRPRARFEEPGPTGAAMLGDALRRVAARFGAGAPYSLWVRTAPRGAEHFCWRIDVLPRRREPGGMELGTGLQLNPVSAERAAAEYRDL